VIPAALMRADECLNINKTIGQMSNNPSNPLHTPCLFLPYPISEDRLKIEAPAIIQDKAHGFTKKGPWRQIDRICMLEIIQMVC